MFSARARMRLFEFLVVIQGRPLPPKWRGLYPKTRSGFMHKNQIAQPCFFAESKERRTMTVEKYDQRLFCLVQFVSRVTGGAEPGSKELMRKRPSGPTSYWRVTKLGATMRVWKRTRGALTL